jgi:hypothetical protein
MPKLTLLRAAVIVSVLALIGLVAGFLTFGSTNLGP